MGPNPYIDPTNEAPEFRSFSKIPRLSRDCVITEKIDGSNAQIFITKEGIIYVGSRNRWIEPGKKDNFGFAQWVNNHISELTCLGPGRYYGEWYGQGIQRKYGLVEKRFTLFNFPKKGDIPSCIHGVVPTLYEGPFDTDYINAVLARLKGHGSKVVPGFMKPEGIVIYHKASGQRFKKTIEHDEEPKGGK